MAPIQQSVTIIQKTQLTLHVYRFTFKTKESIEFTPGQYITAMIDSHTRRQYSFFSPSTRTNQFDIIVNVMPMGPGSKFFLEKKVGDTVDILAPLGNFQMTDTPNRKVFVATGTGIAPFYSMITTYLEHGGTSEVVLYWGLRHEEDIFFRLQLDALRKSSANFQYSVILSQPVSDWKGKTGHVTEYVAQEEKYIHETDFYLCGNRQMVSDVKRALLARKVTEEHIKTEPF